MPAPEATANPQRAVAAAAAPSAPPIDVAGRWKLTAAAGGTCMMTLAAGPGATQGAVAPEGGCPGSFFTSRRWAFEHDALVLSDHKGQVLAHLSFAGGQFEGQDANGDGLVLSR